MMNQPITGSKTEAIYTCVLNYLNE